MHHLQMAVCPLSARRPAGVGGEEGGHGERRRPTAPACRMTRQGGAVGETAGHRQSRACVRACVRASVRARRRRCVIPSDVRRRASGRARATIASRWTSWRRSRACARCASRTARPRLLGIARGAPRAQPSMRCWQCACASLAGIKRPRPAPTPRRAAAISKTDGPALCAPHTHRRTTTAARSRSRAHTSTNPRTIP